MTPYKDALEKYGTVTAASQALGISRFALYRGLKKEEASSEYQIPEGFILRGESVLLDAEGQVKAKWVKTRADGGVNLIESLKSAFSGLKGTSATLDSPVWVDSNLLTLYPLPDLHFGMYSWGQESGSDYDTEIATQLGLQSIKSLVQQSHSSERAIVLGLGDYFHSNDGKNETPASKNRLDVDTRWARVFGMGARLAVQIINLVAQKHKEVEVIMLPGNHDPDSAMALTVALSLFYSSNPRITIKEDPGISWYYRFGKVLLGATHGHTMKPDRMAMMLASDRPRDWGETTFRHFFFGHIHRETSAEIGPVRVESFHSPAARDAWTAASGYRSSRSLQAITFDANNGEVGRHRVNIPSREPE